MMNILFSVFDKIHNANDMAQVLIDLILPIATIMTFMTDLVATILFVVAGHKKNVKLLRVFYFYSIAMFIVTVLLVTFILGSCLQYIIMLLSEGALDNIVIITLIFFVVLVQQTFFLLLLRSENIKLKNTQAEFGFVNNAAEAKCIMKCPEIEEGQENEVEGRLKI